jgi:hypothetical protein
MRKAAAGIALLFATLALCCAESTSNLPHNFRRPWAIASGIDRFNGTGDEILYISNRYEGYVCVLDVTISRYLDTDRDPLNGRTNLEPGGVIRDMALLDDGKLLLILKHDLDAGFQAR